MKKTYVAIIASIVAITISLSSCGNMTFSQNPTLKSQNDSISYALGAFIHNDQGLGMFINQQSGLVTDTMQIRMEYAHKMEVDSTKKSELQKEMRFKIDSIQKINTRNIAEFIKGLTEGINATEAQKAYLMGTTIGNQLSQTMINNFNDQIYGADSNMKVNNQLFLSGLVAAIKKGQLKIENPGVYVDSVLRASEAKRIEKEFGEWKKQNAKYLEDNKSKENVIVLPSGVQYKVLKEGKGKKPTVTDRVKVHYNGTLIDGTVFDSSIKNGEPVTFGVGQVIPGWTEILQLMPVGSKWTVYIPYDKAYGTREMGSIKPYSTLIFDVELLDIEK